MSSENSNYNYTGFSSDDYDFKGFSGPSAGMKSPNPEVINLDGESRELLQFKGDFLVLELGSNTCPLFQSRRIGMETLPQKYPNADFAVLYIREAHPGTSTPGHKTEADKMACATALRDDFNETREILVDDFAGTAHQAFGSFPNSVFIINKQGCIVYRNLWNNASATAKALNALTNGKPAKQEGYFKPARPDKARIAFGAGGKGSAFDFFRSLPKLVWENMICRNFALFMGRSPKVSPDSAC